MHGIIGVFTVADLNSERIGHLPCIYTVTGKDGAETIVPPNPLLAETRTLYVGEPVVMIVGETSTAAHEAAELVLIDYEPLEPVDSTGRALDPVSPQIWPEAPGNLGVDWETGDQAATDAAFDRADHRVSITVTNNRIAACPLEPRAAIASQDPDTDRLTLTTPCQSVHGVRSQIAEHVFRIPETQLRILTPDVGGAFGARFFCNREQILTLWAARRTGRTVRWTADRNECFIADGHGRDHISSGELAIDSDGRFLGLRVSTIANMGSHMVGWGPSIPCEISTEVLTGPYRIPTAHANVKCVFTNMVPVDAYRGTGRAEMIYLLERLVDAAALQLDITPDEIRRRNFVTPDEMPYRTVAGQTYDSGDFASALDQALERADWNGAQDRKAEARTHGRYVGIGMAHYVMSACGLFDENARINLESDGGITVFIGTQSSGQGHATVYTQMIVEQLGISADQVRVVQGDSEAWSAGCRDRTVTVASHGRTCHQRCGGSATEQGEDSGRTAVAGRWCQPGIRRRKIQTD